MAARVPWHAVADLSVVPPAAGLPTRVVGVAIAGVVAGIPGRPGFPRRNVGDEPNGLVDGPNALPAAGANAKPNGPGLAAVGVGRLGAVPQVAAGKRRQAQVRHTADVAADGPLLRQVAVGASGRVLPAAAVRKARADTLGAARLGLRTSTDPLPVPDRGAGPAVRQAVPPGVVLGEEVLLAIDRLRPAVGNRRAVPAGLRRFRKPCVVDPSRVFSSVHYS